MDIIEFRAHHNHLRKASYLHFTEEDTNVQGDELTSAPLSGIKAFLLPQSPLSMEFSRQEHWSGLPCPSQLLSFSLLYLFPLRFWHCPWTVTINFMPLMTNIYWVASAVLSKLPALSHSVLGIILLSIPFVDDKGRRICSGSQNSHNHVGMISKPAQKPLSPILFFKITFNFIFLIGEKK